MPHHTAARPLPSPCTTFAAMLRASMNAQTVRRWERGTFVI